MRLFDRKGDDPSVALALAVGELKAEVAALRREMDTLKLPPVVPESPKVLGIPPRVSALIQQMSQGHGELHRHLEQEARAMMAQNFDEATILHAIQSGS